MEKLLNQIAIQVLRLFERYYENIEKKGEIDKVPILMPITRKGYWLFRYIFNNQELLDLKGILKKFEIYSDRYLTKMLDGSFFYGRDVLLFDDTFVSGTNMFYYYTILRKWGAKVTSSAFKCLIDVSLNSKNNERRFDAKDSKFTDFQEMCEYLDKFKSSEDVIQKEYEKYIADFYEGLIFCDSLSEEDMAEFSVKEIKALEELLCPLVIDLPILKLKEVPENTSLENNVTVSIEQWNNLVDKDNAAGWKFVKNLSKESKDVVINGSYFVAPMEIQRIFPESIVQNCIVKCKYKCVKDNVQAVFVPFVIAKSIEYNDLIEYFLKLYEDTPCYTEIEKYVLHNCSMTEGSLADKLFNVMENHINMYRILYRAVVWYFSNYIAKEFISYCSSKVDGMELDYNWSFMEQHMPPSWKETMNIIKNSSQSLIKEKISKLFGCIQMSASDYHPEECVLQSDSWEEAYYYFKRLFAEKKYSNGNRKSKMVTIEKMQNGLQEDNDCVSYEECKNLITKVVALFQEGSCFSNYVWNNKKRKIVERGLIPGENSVVLLGMPMVVCFPYIYFYYVMNKEDFSETYNHFANILETYFQKRDFFSGKISRKGFKYCIDYFRTDDATMLKKKIENNVYLLYDTDKDQIDQYESVRDVISMW